jgi:dipeptidyl aminopeptidase/acylaminoacyl peptidase
MVRLGSPFYNRGGSSKGIVASFSVDGKQFTVVLRRGDLEQNTNEYDLLLFQTADVFRSPRPRTLVSFSSSSNRPAISEVSWLNDNDTIVFLGERPGERSQIYSIRCSTGMLGTLSQHPTNVVSYAITPDGKRLVYAAEGPVNNLLTEKVLRNGFHVLSDRLSDLIIGRSGGGEYDDHELFVKDAGAAFGIPLQTRGRTASSFLDLTLSPDGKYVVVRTEVTELPLKWTVYEDAWLQVVLRHRPPPGTPTRIYRYELIDTATGASRDLLDAPLGSLGSGVAWSPDSQAVVVAGTHLPLEGTDLVERKLTAKNTFVVKTFVVEIKVPGRQIIKITDQDLRLIRWDARSNLVQFETEAGRLESFKGGIRSIVNYRKTGAVWRQVEAMAEDDNLGHPEIVLEESLNTPPQIVALDKRTRQKSLLLDLNRQFKQLAFGSVREVQWKDTSGNRFKGGLYFPPEYKSEKKYPLVIQTHGFDPDRFWIDGPWPTAFAAQPLAGNGFVVLQVDEGWDLLDTPKEAERSMAAYEGAIEYLDRQGLIDRNRVGLIGFSRTCYYVKYTLTHSKYRFAAASVTDGVDAGYFQYLALSNSMPPFASDAEAVNGSAPFGKGLSDWLKVSPGFQLDRVQTPLRIEAIGPTSLLLEWEWFSGLSRLGAPVDMIYLPAATHILERPWERMTSQQGNVDWFRFWLKGEEDSDPAKAEQYVRWRELRKLQEQNEKNSPAPSPN